MSERSYDRPTDALGELLETGKIKPVIDRTVALSDVPAAIRYPEEERARGKIVVTVELPLATS